MHALTSHWALDPSLIYVALAAVLYWLGGVRDGAGGAPFRNAGVRGSAEQREMLLRESSFALGLLVIVLALCSPVDYYSDELFWVHMTQHILLLTVAPPLILLGRPWPRMWRAIPLSARAPLGRGLARGGITRPLRLLTRPLPAWILFNVDLLIWHVPKFYDLTLSHQWIHNGEHTLFFFTGLLFWAHIIDPGPLRSGLSWPVRGLYVIGAMIVGWGLAVALVLYPYPLYHHYVELATRPGGITALEDQQIAAGMMWVPGSIAYAVTALIVFSRWAAPEPLGGSRRRASVTA